jgi:hypothetical protein
VKKPRAEDLNEERIEVILETLDAWQGKLTWNLLIEDVEKKIGQRYSRFTLGEYPGIANAFDIRKRAVREKAGSRPLSARDERVQDALERARVQKARADRLQAENQRLLEQFVVWATNAERKGVTMSILNAPLPKPPRDRSKGVD